MAGANPILLHMFHLGPVAERQRSQHKDQNRSLILDVMCHLALITLEQVSIVL